MSIVYLDTETTGLDPALHEVWEIAWAVDDGPVQAAFVAHHLAGADQDALRIGGHDVRCGPHPYGKVMFWNSGFEDELRDALTGNTLCAANPAFDAAFLRARWRQAPWKYRLLDVESYAMGAFGWTEPKGLRDIRSALTGDGFDIPAPDHTAAADVECVRACYRALRHLYGGIRQETVIEMAWAADDEGLAR